jgi:hypothetical protein
MMSIEQNLPVLGAKYIEVIASVFDQSPASAPRIAAVALSSAAVSELKDL